jgi:integrase
VLKFNAYYYLVPKGQESLWDGRKWFRLGDTLADAHRAFAERIDASPSPVKTISDLLDRYELEVVPQKAAKTQTENRKQIATLRTAIGHNSIHEIEPQHVYQYIAGRKSKKPGRGDGKTAAKREIEVLSHAFTKAVEWGVIKAHPFKGEVRIAGSTKPRARYVEDWELAEALRIKPLRKKGGAAVVQSLLRLKILTGLRQRDLLQIEMTDIKPDGLHVFISKTKNSTGRRVIYSMTDSLRAEIDRAVSARPADSNLLFCTRDGISYVSEDGTASSWGSLWENFMERVLNETKVTERFTEHDMRAKVGSDAESLERAQQLLGHADPRMTQKVYRRRPERIDPTK